MKQFFFLCLCAIPFCASSQLTDNEIRNLKTGKVKNDSSYVYCLPHENGTRHLFVQGANSKLSHKDELSFDFKTVKGSKICTAREVSFRVHSYLANVFRFCINNNLSRK